MKTVFISLALACCVFANAQVLQVGTPNRLPLSDQQDLRVAGISPQGDYILLTSGSNQGLVLYDLSSEQTTLITEQAGAGYCVQMSADGRRILFRETVVGKDKLRRHNMVQYNLNNRSRRVLARKQRVASPAEVLSSTSVGIQDRQIVLTINGQTSTITPNGEDESYIWPSISPDGNHLCYYVCGVGCYVSNIDGSKPQFIARDCRAPQWYDNNTLVAMADEDDGHFTTSSAIVAYSLNGQSQVLTPNNMIAMYPYAAKGKIVFSAVNGEIYLLNVQ